MSQNPGAYVFPETGGTGELNGTEDKNNPIDPHQKGVKLDSGKLQASLLLDFSLALKRVAEVSVFGANKYTKGGWQFVENGETRYYDAFMRHLLDSRHEPFDKDSGLPHLYHALWNLLAVVELSERSVNQTEQIVTPPLRGN